MSSMQRTGRILTAALSVVFVLASGLSAQSADGADFYRAYYLEKEQGKLEAAYELYRKVAADRDGAPGNLRREARRRAGELAEDLASSDFARLVPHDALFYAELSRPGEQLGMLLDQLGLLGGVTDGEAGAFGISPLLVESALGLRGAAMAVTGVDMASGMPNGVVILHPGDLDLVRGLLETALPAGGMPVEPIGGFPTWKVENEALVTLTSRLVVASPDPGQIEGVLERLRGDDEESLASNPNVVRALKARGEGLISFCINPEQMLPIAEFMLAQQAQNDPEMAMALSFLDVGSLRCISGHVGVTENGIDMEVALELAEGHRNMVFNLMRHTPVQKATLAGIPSGAAFFLAGTYNPEGPVAPIMKDSMGQPVVTIMDFGRELFGNLVDVAVYGLPPENEGGAGWQIPDVAAVMRVNDPQRSMALWDLVFDLATQGSSQGRVKPRPVKIAGVKAVEYNLGGVPVYLATEGGRLVLSPSKVAVARSIDAVNDRGSVLEDRVYAKTIRGLADDAVFVAMANGGRCAAMALPYVPPQEMAQVGPIMEMCAGTVLAVDTEHSETRLAFRTRIRNVPDVSGMVAQAIHAHRGTAPSARTMTVAASDSGRTMSLVRSAPPVEEKPEDSSKKKKAVAMAVPNDSSDLRATFDALVEKGASAEKTEAVGRKIAKTLSENPMELNNFAWALLTEDRYGHRFNALALDASMEVNRQTKFENWIYLDTLAHAVFFNGSVEKAIDIEKKAIELAGDDARVGEAEAALKRFLAARGKEKAVSRAPDPPDPAGPAKPEKGPKASKEVPTELAVLRKEFDVLVKKGAGRAEVLACGEKVLEAAVDEPAFLNGFAWQLLVEEAYGNEFDELALDMSMRSNKLERFKNWFYVDTLAHAVFRSGDVEGAIGLAQTALALAGDHERRGEAAASLERFRAALEEE